MKQYHKINSIFKRDMVQKSHPFIMGAYADPAVEYLQHNEWEWTEKVDGTNIRIMWDGLTIAFGGKTDNAQLPPKLLAHLCEVFISNNNIIELLIDMFPDGNACLYGEGFGHKIQGKVGLDYLGEGNNGFYLFDIMVNGLWLTRESVVDIGEKLGLILPVVHGHGTIDDAINEVQAGFKSHFGTADAEGLVLRPMEELLDRRGNRIITKVKHRDFKEATA